MNSYEMTELDKLRRKAQEVEYENIMANSAKMRNQNQESRVDPTQLYQQYQMAKSLPKSGSPMASPVAGTSGLGATMSANPYTSAAMIAAALMSNPWTKKHIMKPIGGRVDKITRPILKPIDRALSPITDPIQGVFKKLF